MRYSSILDTIGNTPLVELKSFSPRPGVQIFAKLEGFQSLRQCQRPHRQIDD